MGREPGHASRQLDNHQSQDDCRQSQDKSFDPKWVRHSSIIVAQPRGVESSPSLSIQNGIAGLFREDVARNGFHDRMDAELGENVLNVIAHRRVADIEL